ncbi:MAG: glycosyltransferase [Gammaproteobacteria bacterium]|nr:glycosyltransferase [Gammaproteobacteria bacterium]
MRILHLLDSSAPIISGYSSRSRAIVNAQRAAGHEPIVLTSSRQYNDSDVECEVIDDIKYYRSSGPAAQSGIPLMEMHRFRKRILEVARLEGAEVLHAHSPILTGLPTWLAARQLGLKCVYEMRSLWEDASVESGAISESSLRYKMTRGAETFLMRRVDAVVCICEGLRRDLVSRGLSEEKLFVVPNGVDASRFSRQSPDAETLERFGLNGKVVVGYIGTFFGFEGVTDLVEAIAKLINGGRDDVRGLIVGRGVTYEACRAAAERYGLSDKILHPGHVPSEQVEGLYSVIDVLAYPRHKMRITDLVTPLKPLEAMAMEKAVVGSDVGGISELVNDGVTGLTFPAGNVERLAAQIERLVDDEDLRQKFGKQGRDWVETQRDWNFLVRRYDEIYQSLLST